MAIPGQTSLLEVPAQESFKSLLQENSHRKTVYNKKYIENWIKYAPAYQTIGQ